MKLLILRSKEDDNFYHLDHDPYTLTYNTAYADRFLGHLRYTTGYCRSCGDNCIRCKEVYSLDYSKKIASTIAFPATLPAILDDPGVFVPEKVPSHDILIAISVNEEVLFSFIKRHPVAKGVIVPIEETRWLTPYARNAINQVCMENEIEIAFPKPFCSFDPDTEVLKQFKNMFRIGKPEIEYKIDGGVIDDINVICSAPCGATYYTARQLYRKRIGDNLEFIIDMALSSYPCTAGRELDREFNDSITHHAVIIQRNILNPLKDRIK
ncbi:MAG: hypothetical protein JSV25_06690 [Spirochaetota bacterium]|nr:MAG: hypothetical protein JSV25_06690 [Spirochaetota bacterium]